jgi:hypothetical protein
MKTKFFVFMLFLVFIGLPMTLVTAAVFFIMNAQHVITDPVWVMVILLATAFLTPRVGFSNLYVHALAVRLKPRGDKAPLTYWQTLREVSKVAKSITHEMKFSQINLRNARHLYILLKHSSSPIDFPGLYVICWYVEENEKLGFFDILRRFLEARKDTEFQGLSYVSRRRWVKTMWVLLPLMAAGGIYGIRQMEIPWVLFSGGMFLILSLFAKLFFWPVWVGKAHFAVLTLRDRAKSPTEKSLALIQAGFKLW